MSDNNAAVMALSERYGIAIHDKVDKSKESVYYAFFGDHPTLADIDNRYGEQKAAACIVPHLLSLSAMSGARVKMDEFQVRDTAKLIATTYPNAKITEIALFISRMKAGRYAQFYGSVDPMTIMRSLKYFMTTEKAFTYECRKSEEQERRFAEQQRRAVSYEQYQAMKKAGEI